MDQARTIRKLLDWRPVGTRPVGRPRQRWQEDVMKDVKKPKVKNGRKQLRIEELGERQLRRPKPTKMPNDDDDDDDDARIGCCRDHYWQHLNRNAPIYPLL
jgi:hypothetical protein